MDPETHQCFVGSDGKVIQLHDSGALTLHDADARKGYKELARAQVIDGTWASPALVGGKFYIRSNTKLVCVDLAVR